MSKFALICGIAGGIWAIGAGFVFLIWVLSTSTPGFVGTLSFWGVSLTLISIVLMGVLSLMAVAQRIKKPRLTFKRISGSIIGIIIASILGIGIWDIFVLPAVILLIPAAIEMGRGIVKTQG